MNEHDILKQKRDCRLMKDYSVDVHRDSGKKKNGSRCLTAKLSKRINSTRSYFTQKTSSKQQDYTIKDYKTLLGRKRCSSVPSRKKSNETLDLTVTSRKINLSQRKR